jgi:hypothetical protein
MSVTAREGVNLELTDSIVRKQLAELFGDAVRKWINIKIDDHWFAYGGGVSGAKVFDVGFEMSFTGLSEESVKKHIVLKLDSENTFIQEEKVQKQLENLPSIKKHFVAFCSPKQQIKDRFFMVLEPLDRYESYERIIYRLENEPVRQASKSILDAMETIQFGECGKKETVAASLGARFLHFTYFSEIGKSLFELVENGPIREEMIIKPLPLNQSENEFRGMSVHDCISKLWLEKERLQPRFTTRMHGDCHPRNVVFDADGDPRVKFIDVDKFSLYGDYINDFGVLLADLEVLGYLLGEISFSIPQNNRYNYELKVPPTVEVAQEQIRSKVTELARQDESLWDARLSLAKARYLLSMVSRFPPHQSNKAFVAFCEAAKALQDATKALEEGKS